MSLACLEALCSCASCSPAASHQQPIPSHPPTIAAAPGGAAGAAGNINPDHIRNQRQREQWEALTEEERQLPAGAPVTAPAAVQVSCRQGPCWTCFD